MSEPKARPMTAARREEFERHMVGTHPMCIDCLRLAREALASDALRAEQVVSLVSALRYAHERDSECVCGPAFWPGCILRKDGGRVMWANENDPFPAQWLRNLWPSATVDERSIADVRGEEITSTRVHFFAGIGGWEYALELAGWPADRPIWTGSCPCQPFSAAGRGKGDGPQ